MFPLWMISSPRLLSRQISSSSEKGREVGPPFMWAATSASTSSTTSAPIREDPGMECPPVWVIDVMPYLRAQAIILRPVVPSFTVPRPTSPTSVTPASASSLKSFSSRPCSRMRAPARTFMPVGEKFAKARCAVIASALTPITSRGRPGRCTSPAETSVVTPPCSVESIQPSWFWRGVQSPMTGWEWLSIMPGMTEEPLASITRLTPLASILTSRPTAVIFPFSIRIVSASARGAESSPVSTAPRFRIRRRSA